MFKKEELAEVLVKGRPGFIMFMGADGMDLSGVDLSGKRLVCKRLAGIILDDADLSYADCTAVDFSGASLRRANLTGAKLSHSTLNETDLTDAVLTDTILDPSNEPNGNVSRFRTEDGYVIGYRSDVPLFCNGPAYVPGNTYTAPWFSTCTITACHPGLYLCPTIRHVPLTARVSMRLVEVRSKPENVHYVEGKWRTKEFTVMRKLDI